MPGDIDALYGLRLEALAADPDAFLRTHAEELARGPARLAQSLAGDETAVFGAEDHAGGLVAMVGIHRETPVKWRHKVAIWGVYVRTDARGHGLGGALIDLAIALARSWPGVVQIHLSAEATHRAALALYESRGFVAWGTEPGGTLDGDRAMPETHMWLDLRA